MILAAAVRYKVEATGKEVVLCGARHSDVFSQLDALGLVRNQDYYEIAHGFIDHKNNFLTREEAYEHAKMCGQICAKIVYQREDQVLFGKKMISEDLW